MAALRDEDLDVAGLMAVGRPGPRGARPGFGRLASLADTLDLPVRSMGMTDDLEVALSEGSTMVRLGRALFGDRPRFVTVTPWRSAPSAGAAGQLGRATARVGPGHPVHRPPVPSAASRLNPRTTLCAGGTRWQLRS